MRPHESERVIPFAPAPKHTAQVMLTNSTEQAKLYCNCFIKQNCHQADAGETMAASIAPIITADRADWSFVIGFDLAGLLVRATRSLLSSD
jgi:hypothetical protein